VEPCSFVVGTGVVSVTGQIVVETGIVTVVTDPYGQFVTVGAQLRIVEVVVMYTTEVEPCGDVTGTELLSVVLPPWLDVGVPLLVVEFPYVGGV